MSVNQTVSIVNKLSVLTVSIIKQKKIGELGKLSVLQIKYVSIYMSVRTKFSLPQK